MNAYDIVKARFLTPFDTKTIGNIGVELEFPMLNMNKAAIDRGTADGLLEHFVQNGFEVEAKTTNGKPAFIYNADSDALSFDNSYNNFEFAMNYGANLCDIAERFYALYAEAQAFLLARGHTLTGMGTNPYKAYIKQDHVSFPVYNMVDDFLHAYPAAHKYPDFPSYLSSVQTHLDVDFATLPRAATLFARLDFVRVALFSNSPSWEQDNCLCFRDFLWEGSAFPNIGKVDEVYNSLEDIADSFLQRKMFNRIRNGVYEVFAPVTVADYFNNAAYGAEEGDINQFLSFRNIEITARGTLEIRSDCAQPVSQAFAPPAFSLGIMHNLASTEAAMRDVFAGASTAELRNTVITGEGLDFPEGFLDKLVCIAADGLKSRGLGEEKHLAPLYERAKAKTSPAAATAKRLANGESIEDIIADYSRIF